MSDTRPPQYRADNEVHSRWDLREAIRRHILKCIANSRSKEDAAKDLGISRAKLYRKLTEYGYFDKPVSTDPKRRPYMPGLPEGQG